MADAQLFEETFSITGISDHKYDRVSRISGTSPSSETFMTLDINKELYPCAGGDRIHMVLASTLNLDGSKDDGKGWRDVGRGMGSLADMYEYVCHGKIYRFEEGDGEMM
jgi:DNA-directed RNA polymerase I, II, and III subunit RPABC3